MSFPLSMGCDSTGQLAKELQFKMWFHQDGIAQILIGEPGNTRFQISQEDLPVDWDNLRPGNVTAGAVKDEEVRYTAYGEDGLEIYTYHIMFNPFKIEQRTDGKLTQVINPRASLYVEESVASPARGEESADCFSGLRERTKERTGEGIFAPQSEASQSISMSSWMPAQHLFGIPERETSLALRRTTNAAPFRLFATD